MKGLQKMILAVSKLCCTNFEGIKLKFASFNYRAAPRITKKKILEETENNTRYFQIIPNQNKNRHLNILCQNLKKK